MIVSVIIRNRIKIFIAHEKISSNNKTDYKKG
jgi:hypothetical protein